MIWPFVPVANACVEILLIIGLGYVLTWRGFITDKFLPQINAFLIYVSFPALNLSSIGINLNLRDGEGWKALAAYILWVTIIQVGVLVFVRIFKKGDVGEAALLNLLLGANNTIIVGLPIMTATFGTDGRYIALLTGVPLFLQIMPFSIVLFELERWVVKGAGPAQPGSDAALANANTTSGDSKQPGGGDGDAFKPAVNDGGVPGAGTGAPPTPAHTPLACNDHPPAAPDALATTAQQPQPPPDDHPLPSPFTTAAAAAAHAADGGHAAAAGRAAAAPSGLLLRRHHSRSEGDIAAVAHFGGHGAGGTPPSSRPPSPGRLPHRLSHQGASAPQGLLGAPHQPQQHHDGVQGLPHRLSGSGAPRAPSPLPGALERGVASPRGHGHGHGHGHHPLQHAQHRSRSIQEQLQLFFHEAAELRRRKKEAKRRQRALVSVADVPLPLSVANAQICNAPLPVHPNRAPGLPLATSADDLPQQGAARTPGALHGDDARAAARSLFGRAAARADGPSRGERGGALPPAAAGADHSVLTWHDWPWEAWHQLVHASKQGLYRIADSFSAATASGRFYLDQHQHHAQPSAAHEHRQGLSASPSSGRLGYRLSGGGGGAAGGEAAGGGGGDGRVVGGVQMTDVHQPLPIIAEPAHVRLSVGPEAAAGGGGGAVVAHAAPSGQAQAGPPLAPSAGAGTRDAPLARWHPDGASPTPSKHGVAAGRGAGPLHTPPDSVLGDGLDTPTSMSVMGGLGGREGGKEAAGRREDGPPGARTDKSFVREVKVQRAMRKAVRRHGSQVQVVVAWFKAHAKVWTVIGNIFKNPMMWSLLLALVVSLSGLRLFLDPRSSDYVQEMGWLTETLALLKSTTVPLALFSNGAFLYGKKFWEGNVKKACIIIVIKITVLPFLQLACTKALGLSTSLGMSLILLSICPCATTGFVLASSYGHGAEIITMVTVVMTVLLIPLVLAALNIPQVLGIYDFDSADFPYP